MADNRAENALSISWYASEWIPLLNQSNILDYFSERSNPFYDTTCNNEIVKMQRLNPEQMKVSKLPYSPTTCMRSGNALGSQDVKTCAVPVGGCRKACHIGIHWKALGEYFRVDTYMYGTGFTVRFQDLAIRMIVVFHCDAVCLAKDHLPVCEYTFVLFAVVECVKNATSFSCHCSNMPGLEYILLHVQEPILYVIRKQLRHSPTQVTPLADYYIIAGVVYQAPDLCSVINSRMLNTVCSLQSAFDEALSYSRYHPSKGYYFEFKDQEPKEKTNEKKKEEPGSVFQRQRVDVLLGELAKKYPFKTQNLAPEKQEEPHVNMKQEPKEIKTEKGDDRSSQSTSHSGIKPPPEKKAKLIR